ncbi:guanylate kinase [Martelella mediterranea]|uniref:guanylate kinase n=1 Tax=Martelella mediterranea TaxID=293089 RepID=UPI001E5401E3|nr:guanylate kinase [Martelella mediterranea]MCD1635268.1 guanylate kinase [Martelella mediterranea]
MDVSETVRRRGVMLVLAAPSGAGKSTIARRLLAEDPMIDLSISATTRQIRPSEREGVHYFFMDPEGFMKKRDEGAFLEWAEVHGNYYATPKAAVEQSLAAGRDVLFDIDVQGAEQLKQAMPGDVVGIFVLPPSMEALRARLLARAEDSKAAMEVRLKNATGEISHWRDYEYVVINDDLDDAYDLVRSILRAERAKRERETAIPRHVESLLGQ